MAERDALVLWVVFGVFVCALVLLFGCCGLLCRVLVGCLAGFRHAGVWLVFRWFWGCVVWGWFAWLVVVVYVVLLLPLAG
ncbi:hypothetical protein ACLUWG_06620, partial [Bifidobacterium apri]